MMRRALRVGMADMGGNWEVGVHRDLVAGTEASRQSP